MLGEDLARIGAAYLALAGAAAWQLCLGALGMAVAVALAEKLPARGVAYARLALALGALGAGLWLAVSRLSLFDDAYISFRYAQNLIDGQGLIWNRGEHVEGYTNFLWTLLVAAIAWLGRLDPASVGLWLSVVVLPCQLFVVYRIERLLSGDAPRGTLPLATLALALQDSFVTAGSTGLETGFASMLVAAGLLALLSARALRDWALAGLLLILATLTRPDHAIFYAAGSLVLVAEQGLLLARLGRAEVRDAALRAAAYAAPFLLYVAHLAFRRAYYGQWMPNTFYAKAASQSYHAQGLRYAATFYLASHFWALSLVLLPWLAWPTSRGVLVRFKLFAALSLVLYNYYVIKVGGDFMFGRFYVVLLPLVLIGVAQAARDLLNGDTRATRAGYAVVALLGASLGGLHMIEPRKVDWGIAEERTFYPLTRLNPPVVDHANFRVAQVMASWRKAGLDLRLATSAIGMIGYYSRMEVVDLAGLTDFRVAHQKLGKRGRPGHERRAKSSYIRARNPHLVRWNYHGESREALTRVTFSGSDAPRPWYIYHYDRSLMERVAALTPDVHFQRFDSFLRRYIEREVPGRSAEDLRADTEFFEAYYFDHNQDPELLSAWTAAVAAAESAAGPAAPVSP